MQEVFEKIIEKIKTDLSVKLYGSKNSGNYMIPVDNAIEIVKQVAEECKNGHFGCNTNGEHEKCNGCCLTDCKNRNTIWFGVSDNNNGWIPCSVALPPQPKANTKLDGRYVELYMVSESESDYPFIAFWNGKAFTGGIFPLDVVAWQPLPEPYQPNGE